MSTKKKIFLGIAIVVLAGGLYAYREYNRKNKDLADVSADLKISSTALIDSFEKNEAEANKNFLDKVIQVNGTAREVIRDEKGYYTIVLSGKEMSSIRCSMDTVHQQAVSAISTGNPVSVKGVCTGFNSDELLGSDVILNRCVLTKEK